MAVIQTADKITTILTATVEVEAVVVGSEIQKDMLKLQNADGKAEDMALPEMIMMMMTEDTVHRGIVIMRMTTGDMDVPVGLPTTITKIVVEIIHVAVVMIMMMMITEALVVADGLEIPKVIQKRHAKAGTTEVAITVVVLTTEAGAIAAPVAADAGIAMMMTPVMVKGVAGMAILKVIQKPLKEAGKTADINNCKKKSRNYFIATFSCTRKRECLCRFISVPFLFMLLQVPF
jgi:hypothetical protein